MTNGATSGIGRRRNDARNEGGESYSQRRDAIVSAAAEVFRERGYGAVGLRDIAERLGTNRASLYYYVASKGELFQLVTQAAVSEVTSTAEEIASAPGSPSQRLRDLVVSTLVAYERHFPYMFAYIQEDMTQVKARAEDEEWAETMAELGVRFQRSVISLLDEGVASGAFAVSDTHIAAYALIGAINWTHRWFRPGGKIAADRVGQMMADMMLHGLAADH